MKDENNKLTKEQLVELVSDQEKLTPEQASKIVNKLFSKIQERLKKKDYVKIPGFGKFFVSRSKAKDGFNPKTREKIRIAAANHPKFSPAKSLKELIDPKKASKVIATKTKATTKKSTSAQVTKTKPVAKATSVKKSKVVLPKKTEVQTTTTSQTPKTSKVAVKPKVDTTKKSVVKSKVVTKDVQPVTTTKTPTLVAKPKTTVSKPQTKKVESTSKAPKVVTKPKSPTPAVKKEKVATPTPLNKKVFVKPTPVKQEQHIQTTKKVDIVDRNFKNNEEFYQVVKETVPVVEKPLEKVTEQKIEKQPTHVDAQTLSQSKIFKNSEFVVDEQNYSEPTKIQKNKMKNVFNLSRSHKQFKALNAFTWLFLFFFLLMIIGPVVIKLVNAMVYGNGISAQFWNGPNGEPIAMSFSNLNTLSDYLDLAANIMIMAGIPLFGVLFFLFLTITITVSLKNALRSSEYNRVEIANLPNLIKVETKSQTLVGKK